MMVVRCFLVTLLALLMGGPGFAGKLPDTIVLSPEVLAETKRRVLERDRALVPAYEAFIGDAERALRAPAETVIFKPAPPPGGRLHDYWSLSPSWWPNPHTRDGMPFVRRDGERNPEAGSDKYDRTRMRRMSSEALTLALAWYMTGNEEYAGKGTALIWSWCCDSVTRTNPNLKYARSRPGSAQGHHTGIVETRDLIKVVEAARLLEPSRAWSRVVEKKVVDWFRQYLEWLQTSTFGRLEAGMENYHATWYDAQLAVFALFTGRETTARNIISNGTPRRMLVQIQPGGSMPYELERSRSRHYTFFALQAYFTLAAVAQRLDMDIWEMEPAPSVSLKAAFDYAAPYLSGDEPWPHGEAGPFDPFAFTPLFHRAAMVYKEDRYLDYLKALPADKLTTDRAQLFY